ncbi:hypothetical protein KOR42_28170 [Thalassoglobus neptunius]|uniref:Uncharacterized protein n=1 Tax=Thalassoglobus neptunius TaxID=1938619 RepID=A0A5C5WZB4_9PLAN|nr:hypothetical protein [Thalassoglobus neptunius]TWT55431.1 hypothetical protein KOR42_28170 [Thalassoglobus neptunius]
MRKWIFAVLFGSMCFGSIPSEAPATDALDALRFRYPWKCCNCKSGLSFFAPYNDRDVTPWPADEPVPTGWVVVGHRQSLLQLSSTCHLLLIRKIPNRPNAEMTMWACQPVPSGWKVIEEFHHHQFPGKGVNAYRIRKIY